MSKQAESASQVALECALLGVHRLQAIRGLCLLARRLQELCTCAVHLPLPCSGRAASPLDRTARLTLVILRLHAGSGLRPAGVFLSGPRCFADGAYRALEAASHAWGTPFMLKTLPLMMTGDPGAKVCSSFFFRPQLPNVKVTFLPLTMTWLASPSWEAADLHSHSLVAQQAFNAAAHVCMEKCLVKHGIYKSLSQRTLAAVLQIAYPLKLLAVPPNKSA